MFIPNNFFEKIFEKIYNSELTGKLNADLLLFKCYGNKFDEVNDWLENENNLNPGKPGTGFKILGIGKEGDYDFSLTPLTLMAYKYGAMLSPLARKNLIDKLLTQKGNNLLPEKWGCIIPETENHLLSTNISLHLTNQLIYKDTKDNNYNNELNGVNDWLFNYLLNIKINGFFEYNSKPYFSWTARALQNLYSYTESKKIKNLVKDILDNLFFKYAVQSKNGYLILPFRRRPDHVMNLIRKNDEFATWFLALSGEDKKFIPDNEFEILEQINHDMCFIFSTMIQDYRPHPDLINLVFSNDSFFVKYKYTNIEITYKEKNFALFAGGIDDNYLPIIPSANDASPRQTCLFLNDDKNKVSELIRFELPEGFWRQKNNSGVYENFACGTNLIIPELYNIKLKLKLNNIIYRFIETEHCYIVTGYINNTLNVTNTLFNVGFLEIVNKSEFNSFNDFFATVAKNNNLNYLYIDEISKYKTTRGKEIYFKCLDDTKEWLIKKVSCNNTIIDGNEFLNKNDFIVQTKNEMVVTINYYTSER